MPDEYDRGPRRVRSRLDTARGYNLRYKQLF
jgi:hypothetical protein